MNFWKTKPNIKEINQMSHRTMLEHTGIVFTEIGDDYLKATMPVDHRTRQAMGILHGGASVVLAETLGSVASYLIIDNSKYFCIGLEINANHVRSKKEGVVTGIAKAIHIGAKSHIWEIRIIDEKDKLICISRLTMAVLPHK